MTLKKIQRATETKLGNMKNTEVQEAQKLHLVIVQVHQALVDSVEVRQGQKALVTPHQNLMIVDCRIAKVMMLLLSTDLEITNKGELKC